MGKWSWWANGHMVAWAISWDSRWVYSQEITTEAENINEHYFFSIFNGQLIDGVQGMADAAIINPSTLHMSWNAFPGQGHTNHKIQLIIP